MEHQTRYLNSLKICLVCSHGGHLVEMLRLIEAFEGRNYILITQRRKYSIKLPGASKVYIIPYLVPNFKYKYGSILFILINLIIETFAELIILLKERPDVFISTGSEIAIPIFYMAKLLGKKVVFVESLCRIDELSVSAKVLYPIVDLLLVQWKSLLVKYPKAQYKGRIV